jgi:hypothetical protein
MIALWSISYIHDTTIHHDHPTPVIVTQGNQRPPAYYDSVVDGTLALE